MRFKDVDFSYTGAEKPALENLTLDVAAGETIALVGATGAGKSTAVKLVARYYDATGGSVLIDGVDVREYDLPALRARMGVVPQEAHLFSGTVADNVRYGRPEATDAEVEAAVRAVGALDGVAALPAGFRQPVGERGRSCRPDSGNSSRWPEPNWSTRTSSCWTKRPPPWTPPPKPQSSAPPNTSPGAAPPS